MKIGDRVRVLRAPADVIIPVVDRVGTIRRIRAKRRERSKLLIEFDDKSVVIVTTADVQVLGGDGFDASSWDIFMRMLTLVARIAAEG